MDMMVLHGQSVARGLSKAMLVVDMPFGAYEEGREQAFRNAVRLMTLHSAKGLEFRFVHLVGLEDGTLPHEGGMEEGRLDEERRLFYVGITRARKRLYLSLAASRASFGDVNIAMPSRYLQEIPTELIEWRQSPGMANSRGGASRLAQRRLCSLEGGMIRVGDSGSGQASHGRWLRRLAEG